MSCLLVRGQRNFKEIQERSAVIDLQSFTVQMDKCFKIKLDRGNIYIHPKQMYNCLTLCMTHDLKEMERVKIFLFFVYWSHDCPLHYNAEQSNHNHNPCFMCMVLRSETHIFPPEYRGLSARHPCVLLPFVRYFRVYLCTILWICKTLGV